MRRTRQQLVLAARKMLDDAPIGPWEKAAKLECYTFANCATEMRYYGAFGAERTPIPFIENLANGHDIVARLGILSPCRGQQRGRHHGCHVEIDGRLFEKEAAAKSSRRGNDWGHLLDEHYLFDIEEYLHADALQSANPYRNTENPSLVPRLYGYFAGKRQRPHWRQDD